MTDIAKIIAVVAPEVEALGFAVVRIAMFGGTSDPTLQVMAERADTRQLDIADCELISRRLSDVLDEVDPIEGEYRLEVSSPGIDRPLTRLQDYIDWAGYDARIRLVEPQDGRKQFEGRIEGVDGEVVSLEAVRFGPVKVPFAAIERAKLVLTDDLIRATAPLSADGADRIQMEG